MRRIKTLMASVVVNLLVINLIAPEMFDRYVDRLRLGVLLVVLLFAGILMLIKDVDKT